ncbi:MAG: HEPN domain-containing protein [Bacteroidia bacterium]|nr:HEPN domain-containing protein [Bacteroidia bacterium]
MNSEHFKKEAERWLLQAEDDIEAVEGLIKIRKFAQACFLSQQVFVLD